jgi:hypothetical protein
VEEFTRCGDEVVRGHTVDWRGREAVEGERLEGVTGVAREIDLTERGDRGLVL